MTSVRPVCASCVHFKTARTCSAFPSGIPDSIWLGRDSHQAPHPGQVGTATLLVRTLFEAEVLFRIGKTKSMADVQPANSSISRSDS
jgi:hypothetical protein